MSENKSSEVLDTRLNVAYIIHMMNTRFTTKRVANGHFEVYFDGHLSTWRIVNGSLGVSGNGRNVYGIVNGDGQPRWIGPLNSCKKILARELAK